MVRTTPLGGGGGGGADQQQQQDDDEDTTAVADERQMTPEEVIREHKDRVADKPSEVANDISDNQQSETNQPNQKTQTNGENQKIRDSQQNQQTEQPQLSAGNMSRREIIRGVKREQRQDQQEQITRTPVTRADSGQLRAIHQRQRTAIARDQATLDELTEEGADLQREVEQGIETETGALGAQASELEQQVIEQSDALTDPSQVRVVKDGDTLRARLTAEGREQFTDRARARLESKIQSRGGRMNIVGQQLVQQYEDAQHIDVNEAGDGAFVAQVTTESGDTVTERFYFPETVNEDDYRIVEEDGRVSLELTQSGRKEALRTRIQQQTTISPDRVNIETDQLGNLDVQIEQPATADNVQAAMAMAEETARPQANLPTANAEISRVDSSLLAAEAERGRPSQQPVTGGADEEQFGNFEVGWDGGPVVNPEDEDVTTGEDILGDAAQGYSGFVRSVSDQAFQSPGVRRSLPGPFATAAQISQFAVPAARATGTADAADVNIGPISYDPIQQGEGPGERFLEGSMRGTAELANVPALVRTADEAAELGVWYAGEQLAGRGGEATDEVATAGARRAALLAQRVQANPTEMGGMLAGAAAGSYGAMTVASRTSSTLGTATRYAIQPGEEIMWSGASRAFPSTVSRIRGADVRTRSPDAEVEADADQPDLMTRIREAGETAASRAPSPNQDIEARVVRDEDAGWVNVDQRLQDEAVLRVVEARDRLRTAPEDLRQAIGERVPTQQEINDRAYRAGYRTQETYQNIRTDARADVEDAVTVERDGDLAEQVTDQVPSRQQVADRLTRTGYRLRRGYQEMRADVGIGLRAGLGRAEESASRAMSDAFEAASRRAGVLDEVSVDDAADAGRRALDRAGRGARDVPRRAREIAGGVPGQMREVVGEMRDDVIPSRPASLQSMQAAEDTAYRSGFRLGASARDLQSDLAAQIRTAPDRARAWYDDLGDSVWSMQAAEDVAYRSGYRVGARARDLRTDASIGIEQARQAVNMGVWRARELSDLTLEIGPSRPTYTPSVDLEDMESDLVVDTIDDADDVEAPGVSMDPEDVVGGGASGSNRISNFETVDTGGGQKMLVETEQDVDAGPMARSADDQLDDAADMTNAGRVELRLDEFVDGATQGPTLETDPGVDVVAEPGVQLDLGQEPRLVIDPQSEIGQRFDLSTEVDVRLDTRTETETDQRTEWEQRFRQELAMDQDIDGRRESDALIDTRRDPQYPSSAPPSRGEWSKVLEFDIASAEEVIDGGR